MSTGFPKRCLFCFNQMFSIEIKEQFYNSVKSYAVHLSFCGPLVPLLLLTAAVCAIWNELSVYKLETKWRKSKHQF